MESGQRAGIFRLKVHSMENKKSLNAELQQIRREYAREELHEDSVHDNPIRQFGYWFEQALESEVTEPNAMSLATATEEGLPSVRIVLLKGFDEGGFRFFTNYKSRKGRELAENPNASLCFFWPELERQVRIDGAVEKLGREESESYFSERPRLSQIGAWASSQSREIEARDQLEATYQEFRDKFEDGPVPAPEYWGGYIVQPRALEFWQGRPGRLHDRILYSRSREGWGISRLAP